jgi:NAD(P)-dependent dehydrogenase (short-subunit alcohol dehydrogenase family)
MASIWVTGSSAGIGRETAQVLVNEGHRVVLHARSSERAADAQKGVPGAEAVLVGDLSSLAETVALAEAAEEHGPFDAIVHNAGIGGGNGTRALTEDGLDPIFQVNVLAPYVLTALMPRPRRLVYLSSGLHYQGAFDPDGLERHRRLGNGMKAYSDSKLCDVLLAFAVARLWPSTLSNAVDPGWIRTRMGGRGAPGPVSRGADTPVWLATSDAPGALVSGRYLNDRQELSPSATAYDQGVQDALLRGCAELSGVRFPTTWT